MRVFFDASVIIASLLSKTGGSSLLFEYISLGKITGITSQTVIEEILEEKHLAKLKRSRQEIEQFISRSGLIIGEATTPQEIESYKGLIASEDAHLIAGANLTKCSHLVTLDKKHVLKEDIRQKFLPLKIVAPKDLLEEILSQAK